MTTESYDLASESAFMDSDSKLLSDTKGEARWVGGISQGHKSSHTLKMMCLVFGTQPKKSPRFKYRKQNRYSSITVSDQRC